MICDWQVVIERPPHSPDGPYIKYTPKQVEERLRSWMTWKWVCKEDCPPNLLIPPPIVPPTGNVPYYAPPVYWGGGVIDGSHIQYTPQFKWYVSTPEPSTAWLLLGCLLLGSILRKVKR